MAFGGPNTLLPSWDPLAMGENTNKPLEGY